MKILLGTPAFSQHFDAGLFWLRALSRLGHHVTLWDYRLDTEPTDEQAAMGGFDEIPDLVLVLKGNGGELPPKLQRFPSVCYWPDAFERTPGLRKQLARVYDQVFTPVYPPHTREHWLPTGWDPKIHRRLPGRAQDLPAVFVGTGTERKAEFLRVLRPSRLFGNGWGLGSAEPVYLLDYVEVLSRAQVIINVHRDNIGVNRRLFESMACGFTITDRVPGIDAVLDKQLADKVAFMTPEEGRTLLQYYQAHPREREDLWRRELNAIEPYTYENAAREVLRCVSALSR